MRRLILADSPSCGYHLRFGSTPSSTARRLDSLMPEWRESFDARNMWPQAGNRDMRTEVFEAYTLLHWPLVVVTLGRDVAHCLGVPRNARWFSHYSLDGRAVLINFPHPSGRNRLWNDPDFVDRARGELNWAARISSVDVSYTIRALDPGQHLTR